MIGPEQRDAGFAPLQRSAEHGFSSLRRSAEHGFESSRRSAEHGFTLVEVIVALFIFGLLAAAGVGLLRFSVEAQAATKARLEDVAAERRLSALLANDLAQMVPRTSRNLAGASLPAFRGRSGTQLMAFVRGGRSNAAEAMRSRLQSVTWQIEKGRIERVVYPLVDGAAPQPPVVMAENVELVDILFRSPAGWSVQWVPGQAQALPTAVELTITRRGSEPVTRKFIAGTGG